MAQLAKRNVLITAENFSLAIAMLFFVIIFILRILAIISHATDLAGVESNVIYSIIRMLDSGELYADPSVIPFSITQYTPVYYYVCAYTAGLLRLDPVNDIYQVYLIGRSWNLIFNLLTAYGVYKISKNLLNLPLTFCLIAGLGSFIFSFPHNFAVRPDSLHDTLAIWAVYFFISLITCGETEKTAGKLLPAIVLAVAAIFTKQNGLQLIIFFLIHYLLTANWKMLTKTFLLSFVLIAASLILLTSYSSSFFQNVLGGVENGIDMESFFVYIVARKLFIIQLLPFIVASMYISFKDSMIFKGSMTERFLCLAVLGTMGIATITSFKKGSNLQYYIVFTNLALILILYYLHKLQSARKPLITAVTYFSLNIMMFAYTGFTYLTVIGQHGSEFSRSRERAAERAAEYIKSDLKIKSGEYVFANLSTDYSLPPRGNINNMLSRNCVIPQLDILNYSTRPLKIFGYQNFNTALITGKIRYIVESDPVNIFSITKDFHRLEEENYRLLIKIDGYSIYEFTGNKSLTE